VASIPTTSAGYIWEDPGDSIMIQVSLDLVERLGAAVQQGLGGGPRGTEIGGLLLGRILPGFGRAVVVEDFEPIPCEHLRGTSYALSPKDRRVLGMRQARRPARQVVGYFRSHTRPGMYLDQDDFTVFSQYFPEAWQVFLLVSPSTDGPATGGFFFWEDGDMNRRSPYRQFPFDMAALAAGDYPIADGQHAVPIAPRPVPVLVPKPQASVRQGLRLPSLPWVVVPIIAVLFLIAGLFVSEKQTPAVPAVAARVSPSIEPLLPEPAPRAAETELTPVLTAEPVVEQAPQEPVAVSKPKPARKPAPKVVAAPPVTVARLPVGQIEPPPPLAVRAEKVEPKLPDVLPARAKAAPPPEVQVTYEMPRAGVFKRAFRKIEGANGEAAAFVPASPIRRISPVRASTSSAAGATEVPVDVKVSIDDAGNVTRAQAMTKGGDMASAALTAARQWQFSPARKHDKPVSSEMVLHFHF